MTVSNNGNVNSYSYIKQQSESIKKRVEAENEGRISRQNDNGLITNPETGEKVLLSSISEETRNRWNERAEMKSISKDGALILLQAADPNRVGHILHLNAFS